MTTFYYYIVSKRYSINLSDGKDYVFKFRLFPYGIWSILLFLNHPSWKITKVRTISTFSYGGHETVHKCCGFFTWPWILYFKSCGYSTYKGNLYVW